MHDRIVSFAIISGFCATAKHHSTKTYTLRFFLLHLIFIFFHSYNVIHLSSFELTNNIFFSLSLCVVVFFRTDLVLSVGRKSVIIKSSLQQFTLTLSVCTVYIIKLNIKKIVFLYFFRFAIISIVNSH